MEAFEFVVATPADIEACINLRFDSISGKDAKMFGISQKKYEKIIKKESSRTIEEWEDFLFKGNSFLILIKTNSEYVGMIRSFEKKDKGSWHIAWAYIKSEYRGKDLGKKLYEIPLIKIKELGGKSATAFVRKNNPRSTYLLYCVGFKRLSIWRIMKLFGFHIKTITEWYGMEVKLN